MLVTREPRWRRLVERLDPGATGYRRILWSVAWWMALMLLGLILANNTHQDPITMEAVLLLGTAVWGAAVIHFLRNHKQSEATRSKAVVTAFLAPLLAVAIVPIAPSRPLPDVETVLDTLDGHIERSITDDVVWVEKQYFWILADLWEAGFLVRDIEELQRLIAANNVGLDLVAGPAAPGQAQIRYGTREGRSELSLVLHLPLSDGGGVAAGSIPWDAACVYLTGPLDGNFFAGQRNLRLDTGPTSGFCEARDD